MRKPIIAGNWKMNKTVGEAVTLVNGLKDGLKDIQDIDIVLCPPFTSLTAAAKIIADSNIQLGAQDVYWEDTGAYTGEVSCPMLKDAGCKYVIIGHSERRAYFSETNENVNKKIKSVIRHNLTPIVCVGETLEQRENGQTFKVIEDHLQGALKDISSTEMQDIVIAYEPVWAIGTGRTATPEQAQEAHNFIRELLEQLYSKQTATLVRIQYGGSVKPENIADLISLEDVDGALVGGASLKIDSFVKIVQGARR